MVKMIPKYRKKPNCLNQKLIAEWHPTKNGNLRPEDFTMWSHKKIFWICEKGHEWESKIAKRSIGRNCPYCTNRKVIKGFNDLGTMHPELIESWDYERNGNLTPYNVTFGSKKKVYWKCKSGHSWRAVICDRSNGSGCPYCSGRNAISGVNDIQTMFPNLAKEIHPIKNNNLDITSITLKSNQKIWWKCEKYGHEWNSVISTRTAGAGCPYCAGKKVLVGFNDLQSFNQKLASEWHPTKNGNLMPIDVTAYSGRKVYWVCNKGHEWQATVSGRSSGNGCPHCSKGLRTSFPEKAVFYYIKKVFPDAIESYKVDWLGRMELDIFIPSLNIGIEYDGRGWHRNIEKDNRKNTLCKENGIILYRLREEKCENTNNDSINFIMKNVKNNNSHVINGIKWLSKQLNVNIDIDLERDRNDINELVGYSLNKSPLTDPKLIKEWHPTKNGNLKPENVAKHSHKKVYWICDKGHEWQSTVSDRTRGNGCPYCWKKRKYPQSELTQPNKT